MWAFKIHRVGTFYWWLIASLLPLPVKAVIAIAKLATMRRVGKYKAAATRFSQRVDAILPELQALDRLPEPRKTQVLAAGSALMQEHEHLQTLVEQSGLYRVPGVTLLMPTLSFVQTKLTKRRQKTHSFTKLAERIESDTFYYDLLLWMIAPVRYHEHLLGDLNEEYSLRHSNHGVAVAKAWYRAQVARTLKDCFWNKVERLAAIGTLIDLLDRWFRR